MTPEEYVRDAMRAFKEAAFDPIAVGWIERAFVRAIGQAIADEREACAEIAAKNHEWKIFDAIRARSSPVA